MQYYKTVVVAYLASFIAVFFTLCISSIFVDPLDIWGIPYVKGINNYKVKQSAFLDVLKPYQYVRSAPDVAYIGSSRVYVGLPPVYDGNLKVYNMGFSSLTLHDARIYLQFMYCAHKPKKIFLGLDFFQFSKQYANLQRAGFNRERLTNLGNSKIAGELFKIQETLELFSLVNDTVKASVKDPAQERIFDKGWDVRRGNVQLPNEKEYYYAIKSFMKDYSQWEYAPQVGETLDGIICDAQMEGVELYLFFNPLSIDLIAAMDASGKLDDFFLLKKTIAERYSVYDFSGITPMMIERNNFYDASHFQRNVGEFMIESMKRGKETPGVAVLRADNVGAEVDVQKERYAVWANTEHNKRYIQYLRESRLRQQELSDMEIANFIGFNH